MAWVSNRVRGCAPILSSPQASYRPGGRLRLGLLQLGTSIHCSLHPFLRHERPFLPAEREAGRPDSDHQPAPAVLAAPRAEAVWLVQPGIGALSTDLVGTKLCGEYTTIVRELYIDIRANELYCCSDRRATLTYARRRLYHEREVLENLCRSAVFVFR